MCVCDFVSQAESGCPLRSVTEGMLLFPPLSERGRGSPGEAGDGCSGRRGRLAAAAALHGGVGCVEREAMPSVGDDVVVGWRPGMEPRLATAIASTATRGATLAMERRGGLWARA